jgi:predicted 3-demethylubiquinone-9 3-methyltransferase (glyoxalase superfamily)
MQKITPHLWFDKEAVRAAEFYVTAFGNGSKMKKFDITRLKEAAKG